MKVYAIAVVVIMTILNANVKCSDEANERVYYDLRHAPQLFDQLVKKYKKTYSGPEERLDKQKIFVRNLRIINKHNAQKDVGRYWTVGPYFDILASDFMRMKNWETSTGVHRE